MPRAPAFAAGDTCAPGVVRCLPLPLCLSKHVLPPDVQVKWLNRISSLAPQAIWVRNAYLLAWTAFNQDLNIILSKKIETERSPDFGVRQIERNFWIIHSKIFIQCLLSVQQAARCWGDWARQCGAAFKELNCLQGWEGVCGIGRQRTPWPHVA